MAEALGLIDHVPYLPAPEETPPSWVPFFDGYGQEEAAAGRKIGQSLSARFAGPPEQNEDVHELLITHVYPIAWLIRDALDAPPARWLGLNSADTAPRHRAPPRQAPEHQHVQRMNHLRLELRWTGFSQHSTPEQPPIPGLIERNLSAEYAEVKRL